MPGAAAVSPKRKGPGKPDRGRVAEYDGLTDADLVAILCREPFGWTPDIVARTSDRLTARLILSRYEEDGTLIPERRAERRAEEREAGLGELPKLETLPIPASVLGHKQRSGKKIDRRWLRVFWMLWQRQGLTPEQIEARFWKKVAPHATEQIERRKARRRRARRNGKHEPGE